ncbi:3621_t:CDS:2 [Ambispora gerdemannii]|uniref:3621_t:CDS:1 n=1 Tax=Ambispora gerdemannii TaxID=144530 RepID=A0A9N8VRC1_9GLOM|nr:3621_t:CDS:2 [Ambispora gerdemannii]
MNNFVYKNIKDNDSDSTLDDNLTIRSDSILFDNYEENKDNLETAKIYAEKMKALNKNNNTSDFLDDSSITDIGHIDTTETIDDDISLKIDSSIKSLSPCVILNIINDQIKQCSNISMNQYPLAQLLYTWEINKEIFQKAYKMGIFKVLEFVHHISLMMLLNYIQLQVKRNDL